MLCNTEMGCLFLQKFFSWVSKFPCKTLRSDICYSSLVSVMRNKAYHFTVEDNGIYYKDRHLVHKRNSSFEFGEFVSSMKRLVSLKRRRALTTWWWPGFFPYTEHQEEEEETEWFSEELMFIYQPHVLFPCCFLIPREIKNVVPHQDIWMGKVLSVPRQVTESIV